MYVPFANEAREEGFLEIADLFTHVKQVERNHERDLLKIIKNGSTIAKAEPSIHSWMCGYCGFITESSEALDTCPLCRRDITAL